MQASTSSAGVLDAALDRLGRIGRFLWSAWIGLAALSLIAALWQLGHEIFGDFVLPAPLPVIAHIQAIVAAPESHPVILATAERALVGLALSLLVGGGLGLVIGYSPAAIRIMRPVVTILIGVPPIAWIVVVMIWFGSTDTTIIATVVAAAAPLLLIGAAEGVITRNRGLDDMARAFGAGPVKRLTTLGLRHVAAHLFPALAISLGTAFKVAVMAELLANVGGIGGELARARANLDVAAALGWVMISVAALIAFEYGIVHPIRSEFERWRAAAVPWGVKR